MSSTPFDFFRMAREMRRDAYYGLPQLESNYHAAYAAVQDKIRAPVFIDDAIASALSVTAAVGLRISSTAALANDSFLVDAYEHIRGLASELRIARDMQAPSTIKMPLVTQIFDDLSDMGYLLADEANPAFGDIAYQLWALGNHMARNVEIIPYSTS